MTLHELAAQYPSWVIWRSTADNGLGSWYATRRGVPLTNVQVNAGMAQTVCADDDAALVQELRRQQEIALPSGDEA
ncbi:hypothetical protein [Nonomuraea aurantiaca]|uniref:hypothetical protein n=1 Tax=Nonomuraea aurantiaca TaxID=2878562 RepID=UPI001CD99EAB|nr:hypothetical protein [Nonomuraea aurantiaca]MCA2220405.1 hypothetical protein [Nonomuraea aurantiaca]